MQRELEKLSKAGILTATRSGNRKVYQANRASPIFKEVRGLILKTIGLVDPLRRALQPHSAKIKVAFVYGSVASGTDIAASDIDLMIIGEGLSYSEIYASLATAEKVLHRAVNPNLMSAQEWKRKLGDKAPFLRKILQKPKLFICGTEDALKAIGQSR
ncbi:MAG TPA: nucleotidyltransferase domain-containing protein [Methyloceanibacter sp.]|nr:nucleotidyltransferase domain-containing protein [Methyloceanibacter sp.]